MVKNSTQLKIFNLSHFLSKEQTDKDRALSNLRNYKFYKFPKNNSFIYKSTIHTPPKNIKLKRSNNNKSNKSMAISLGYKNRSGDFINLEAEIVHPEHLLETWIILSNAFMEEGEEQLSIEKIDFKQCLEDIFNTRLTGLNVGLTRSYYFDAEHRAHEIHFSYQRLLSNPEHICIEEFKYEPLTEEDKRGHYLYKKYTSNQQK